MSKELTNREVLLAAIACGVTSALISGYIVAPLIAIYLGLRGFKYSRWLSLIAILSGLVAIMRVFL